MDTSHVAPEASPPAVAVQGLKTSNDGHGALVLIPQPSGSPDDPLNWSPRKKYRLFFVICFAGFAATLTPTSNQLAYLVQARDYHRSDTSLSYSITAAVAGLFGGPLVLAPLTRLIGRSSVIFWGLWGTLACQIWGASMTGEDDYIPFILSRWLAGMFAALPTILGPAFAMDIFFLHQRGKAFASYELSFLLGVNLGPTVGGFIVNDGPWPYVFWWTIAPVGLALILVFCFLSETGFNRDDGIAAYPEQHTAFWKSRIATFFPGSKVVPRINAGAMIRAATSPLTIALTPITIIAGLYAFVAFGFLILVNVLLSIFLQTPELAGGYGFSPFQNAAFTFVSWVGIAVAQLAGWFMGDRIPLWASRHLGKGVWHTEYRLWNMLLPAILSPVGLGIFGAALQYHLHYMVLALGLFIVTFSALLSVPVCLNYIVECFITSANEAAIAMNCWRLGFAIALGFFVFPWEAKVGTGWVFGMAAFFDVLVALLIALLAWKGHILRRYTMKSLTVTEEGLKLIVPDSNTSKLSSGTAEDKMTGGSMLDHVGGKGSC